MANRKEEQRLASNRRILDSALTEFAQKGFSRALLIDIARNAKVSNGMVTQRFNGKDNLYNQVFVDMVTTYLTKFTEKDSLHRMLTTLVDDIKTGAETGTESFIFVSDLLLSKDSPVDSFELIKEVFKRSALCDKVIDGISNGLIRQGDPFEIMRMFLVSAVGIAKSFSGTTAGMPATSGFLSLLAPSDRQLSDNQDYLKARLTEGLISQLSYEYEAVALVNLESSIFVITKAIGPFADFKPERGLSFDKNIKRYADSFVHPDDRKRFWDFMKKSNLLKRFDPDRQLTISYRINSPEVVHYQTIVRFNTASKDGHWVTIGLKNLERLVREEVRSALTEAQERSDSISAGLARALDVRAYLDTKKDELTFYKLEGKFAKAAGKLTKSGSGSSDLISIISQLLSGEDAEHTAELIAKAIKDVRSEPSGSILISFECTADLRKFRCIMDVAALSDDSDAVVIGISDIDKYLIK
ncbi:MAG: TetR/AcrR family transcriptional regulator [Oscillospiraceae bacterium]|nr:TetR/AcrR family transcriptional regulator [Oscillospiraceae bacterium]